jgi:hypothetical protein
LIPDYSRPEQARRIGLVDFYLGDGVMERQLVIGQRLRELTDEPFRLLWEKGEFQDLSDLGPSPFSDENGRPRPCQVRESGGVKTVVILSEAEHPEAWILMQASKDILNEMEELTREAFGPRSVKPR